MIEIDNQYDAMILYAYADTALAQRLQHDLEKYVLPRSLRHLIGGRKHVSVCVGATDENIANSACMVCVCSEAFALENKEQDIFTFEQTGRRIIPVIFTENPQRNLPAIFKITYDSGEADQVLGPNFVENNKSNRETLRTLACILNIPFRMLREEMMKRKRIQRTVSIIAAILTALTVGYIVDAQVVAAMKSSPNANRICFHTYMAETCTKSAICTQCGQSAEGSKPLGHNWVDDICSRCGIRQGTFE